MTDRIIAGVHGGTRNSSPHSTLAALLIAKNLTPTVPLSAHEVTVVPYPWIVQESLQICVLWGSLVRVPLISHVDGTESTSDSSIGASLVERKCKHRLGSLPDYNAQMQQEIPSRYSIG